jgi:hypothetical protein
MNINNDKPTRQPMPKAVQVMIYIIAGIIMSIGLMAATIIAQVVIYLCMVIAQLAGW